MEWLKESYQTVPRASRAVTQRVLHAQPLPGWIRGALGCSLFAVGDSSQPFLLLSLLLSPVCPLLLLSSARAGTHLALLSSLPARVPGASPCRTRQSCTQGKHKFLNSCPVFSPFFAPRRAELKILFFHPDTAVSSHSPGCQGQGNGLFYLMFKHSIWQVLVRN